MTQLLEEAIAKTRKLPTEEQDAFARWMIEELEDDERWQKAFDASADVLERLADEALADLHAGKTETLDYDG